MDTSPTIRPDGIRILRGRSALLLIAPHGGRREPERRPWAKGSLRVNDLHTADLTTELAERLDADAIINTTIDRNDLDLNRITQVRGQAPWFLDLLADRLEHLQQRHGTVTVLLIHGWNVGNPACDLGLGVRAGASIGKRSDGSGSGVDTEFFAGPLGRLRRACAERGIEAGLGWRYAASNPSNLLQLFTGRYAMDPDPTIRALAQSAFAANAVQLELAIPLRWPGPWRRRFVDSCLDAFGSDGVRAHAPASGATQRNDGGSGFRLAVQFHDASGSVAGIAAWEIGRSRAAARLLLLPPAGGLLLFTGESETGSTEGGGRVGPLSVASQPDGSLAIRHGGPILAFVDTSPFLDLERGLSTATLCEAAVELEVSTSRGRATGFATARGTVHITGRASLEVASQVCGHAFVDDRAQLRDATTAVATLAEGPLGPLRLVVPHVTAPVVQRYGSDSIETLPAADVRVSLDPLHEDAPLVRFTVATGSSHRRDVTCEAIRRVPIVRQGPGGGVSHHLLAFCRFAVAGAHAGHGWLEISGRAATPQHGGGEKKGRSDP